MRQMMGKSSFTIVRCNRRNFESEGASWQNKQKMCSSVISTKILYFSRIFNCEGDRCFAVTFQICFENLRIEKSSEFQYRNIFLGTGCEIWNLSHIFWNKVRMVLYFGANNVSEFLIFLTRNIKYLTKYLFVSPAVSQRPKIVILLL